MPILKVSNDIKKYALELVRVPITILGDCPQCRGNAYRDGICPDCSYVDPRVMESIQEWQKAQGIQQKAAFKSLSFVDMFPEINGERTKCGRCGQITMIDGQCTDAQCQHETPPEGLGFKRPKFLGIDPVLLKKVKKNFLSPAGTKIEDNKKKLKNSAKNQSDPGALQDDSINASMDATTRMKNMLQQSAQIDALEKQKNEENADNSEELK